MTSLAADTVSSSQALALPLLFALVGAGSVVPVVPTGALVGGAAVVAFHQASPLTLLLVLVGSATAALLGDLLLYWLGIRGVRSKNGSRWMRRLQDRVEPRHLEAAQHRLTDHRISVLVLSRLIPAGRIPVMVACLLAEMPLRRFLRADVPACLAWATAYQLIGILGGSLFPEPWQGVMVVVALALLIAGVPRMWRRIRER